MPPVPDLSLGVLHDMNLPAHLQLGARLSVARLPFDDVMTGTVWLTGPELIASASHALHPRIAAIGGVAVGAQLISGLSAGNPFTTDGEEHGAFVALRLRGELGVAWRASDRISVRVAPGYHFMPRRSAFAADIGALHGFAIDAGVSLDL